MHYCAGIKTKSHSRAAVGAGDKPSQVTLKSLSVPTEVKGTKPGWLSVIRLLIHSLYVDTLAYTVGELGSAHPDRSSPLQSGSTGYPVCSPKARQSHPIGEEDEAQNGLPKNLQLDKTVPPKKVQ